MEEMALGPALPAIDLTAEMELARRLVSSIAVAVLGQKRAVELAVCCYIAGGHLLIEDVPGVGKTTLARALAAASGGRFRRIQFTSDLLPSDITGVSVWDARTSQFSFRPGPVFGNVVLADEINRATPKTQSALLEAMSERRVSVDGEGRPLPSPFMVIATQNEQEHHGTYPLPESQLDRFLMRLSMGYPDLSAERRVVSRPTLEDPVESMAPVLAEGDWPLLCAAVDRVHVDESVLDYIMEIVQRTRRSELLELGVGPRGGMALHRAARALALLRGRPYCLVDDVRELCPQVLSHRIVAAGAAWGQENGRNLAIRTLSEILGQVEIPL
ncbi:MAG: AAA family ATPase [Myxococcota bacterium]|jgi:MoxR-like ATPase|nr:AAA family ATPase [Myxococcota bacterium]